MIKRATYLPSDSPLGGFTLVDPSKGESMEKVASTYSSDVLSFLDNLEPDPDLVYALVNALGAGEYFSSNKNGDFFPEEALKKQHPTFVSGAHVYSLHRNKDPRKKLGDVLHSHWNNAMKRVELIITLDRRRERASKVINQLEDGHYVMTSMGARVPYDRCSICDTKARTRAEYCDHLKYQMNKILDDGRKVFAINDTPKFFDISIVLIPADKTSGIMLPFLEKQAKQGVKKLFTVNKTQKQPSPSLEKVASSNEPQVSEKRGSMIKRTPNDFKSAVQEDPGKEIYNSTQAIPDQTIKELGEKPLNETLSTMLALRVLPKQDEFQKIVLASSDRWDLAEELEKTASFLDKPTYEEVKEAEEITKVGPQWVSKDVANILTPHLDKIALTLPAITKRRMEKEASIYPNPSQERDRALWRKVLFTEEEQPQLSPVKNPAGSMAAMGALYAGYIKMFNDSNPTKFRSFMKARPWLLAPALAGGIGLASAQVQQSNFEDNNPVTSDEAINPLEKKGSLERLGTSFLVSAPLSYYKAGDYENQARQGIPITKFENFIRQNPFLTTMIGTGLGYGASKKIPQISKKIKNKLDIE